MRWGFDPDAFWRQTPANFAAAVKARAEADESALERDYFAAWAVERFAREKTLKGFQYYAGDLKPKKKQTPADMLAMFKGLGDRVTIRKRKKAA